jgi:hypothetical protein
MAASFRNNWWDTHHMDDGLDQGTTLPERSSPVGIFAGGTPALGASRCGWNKRTK